MVEQCAVGHSRVTDNSSFQTLYLFIVIHTVDLAVRHARHELVPVCSAEHGVCSQAIQSLACFFVFTHVTSLCGQEKHSRIGFFLLNSTHLLLIVELLTLYSIIQSINQSIKLFVSDYNDP